MEIRDLHLRNLICGFLNSNSKSLLDTDDKAAQIFQGMTTRQFVIYFVYENRSVK